MTLTKLALSLQTNNLQIILTNNGHILVLKNIVIQSHRLTSNITRNSDKNSLIINFFAEMPQVVLVFPRRLRS